ncbi:MAG: hypothetical protein JO019_00655 [Candidatus Kaiserbacteria bacterium]|nr:hypothetical protein [Candidatus Kaiserbacteria bacterium]
MRYICDPHIIPTNTCPPDLAELERRTKEFADFSPGVQLDVADGRFAPVVSWPYHYGQMAELSALYAGGRPLPESDKTLYEIHLMVEDPLEVGVQFARAGASRIIPHIEAFAEPADARGAFERYRAAGAREVGLALLIDTPLESIESVVDQCDVVQLMSIAKIGAQGQPFDERALARVEELHALYPDLLVAVDGGISEANVELLVRAGANRLCVGSAISKAPNMALAYEKMLDRAMRGCQPPVETLA